MHVLLACPDSPHPPRDGGSLRIVNLARSLAQHASVMLLTHVVSPDETSALTTLSQNYGIQVCSVQRPARHNTLARAWHRLRYYYGSYLFTSLPGPVRFNSRPVMREALHQVLRDFAPDVILWEYWFMTGFADMVRAVNPRVVQIADAIDLEWLRLERHAQVSHDLTKRWNKYIYPRIRQYTLEQYRKMDRVVFLSQADAKLVRRDLPDFDRSDIVPMGLRLDEYPDPLAAPQPNRVLFFGSFRHQPNVDALRFLLQDIWPRIQQARPQATLDLMGSDMPGWVRQVTKPFPNIHVLGYQLDIRPALADAAVVIAPLRFGSGVKIKILESMALGKAVVTTPIGAEGIEAQADTDFIVADGAQSLAAETIHLLANPALRDSLGQHAHHYIQTQHDADQIALDFFTRLQALSLNRESTH